MEKIIANEPQSKYSPDCGFYDLMLLYYVEKLSRRGRILCLYPNLWTVIKIEKKNKKNKNF